MAGSYTAPIVSSTASNESAPELGRQPDGADGPERAPLPGVLPAQALRDAVAREWIRSDEFRIPATSIQPASLDLRLGEYAYALRCSFLPDAESTVEEKMADIAFQKIDLRDGAPVVLVGYQAGEVALPVLDHLERPSAHHGWAVLERRGDGLGIDL